MHVQDRLSLEQLERIEREEKDAQRAKRLRIVILAIRGFTAPAVAMSVVRNASRPASGAIDDAGRADRDVESDSVTPVLAV